MVGKHLTMRMKVSLIAAVVGAVAVIGGGSAGAGSLSSVSTSARGTYSAAARLTVEEVSRTSHPVIAAGRVTEVDRVATAGHCGTTRQTGDFVLENKTTTKPVTVDVTRSTKFVDSLEGMTPVSSRATFAVVCVGRSVSVHGTTAAGVVSAATVFVVSPGRFHPETSLQGEP